MLELSCEELYMTATVQLLLKPSYRYRNKYFTHGSDISFTSNLTRKHWHKLITNGHLICFFRCEVWRSFETQE